MQATARLRKEQSSPRKMRYVADMIRGLDVNRALDILQHSSKHGAKPMYKLLLSAIDNWARQNEGMRIEDAQLVVKTIFVDGGKMLKRWLPAPHGRAHKMKKRSNHITIVVDSKILMDQEKQKTKTEAETAPVEPAVAEVEAPVSEVAEKPKRTRKKAAAAE